MSDGGESSPGRWASSRLLEPLEAEPIFRPLWTGQEEGKGAEGEVVGLMPEVPPATKATVHPSAVDALAGSPADPLAPAMPQDAPVGSPQDEVVAPPQPDPALLRREREAGIAEGRAAASAELKAALNAQQRQWRALCDALRMQLNDAGIFIEPLARLALHFARVLSRAGLDVSDAMIRSLVSACLAELGGAIAGATVLLHPDDLAQVERGGSDLGEGIAVKADATLSRGSVRVVCGEAMIEDLAERRFQALAHSLLAAGFAAPQDESLGEAAATPGAPP